MKRTLLLVTGLLFAVHIFGQTVENIRVEPDGESIKISYRIGGSTESQLYDVYLTCSMDGGSRFEPRSVIGDVGRNIRGGRSYYTVIWDVFKDVEEVGSAEFFVRVVLVSDGGVPVGTPQVRQEEPVEERRAETDQKVQPSGDQSPREVARADATPFDPSFDSGEKEQQGRFDRYLYVAYTGGQWNPFGFSFGNTERWGNTPFTNRI